MLKIAATSPMRALQILESKSCQIPKTCLQALSQAAAALHLAEQQEVQAAKPQVLESMMPRLQLLEMTPKASRPSEP